VPRTAGDGERTGRGAGQSQLRGVAQCVGRRPRMMTRNDILKRLAAELTRVVGALLENSASSRAATARHDDAFVVSLSASAGQQGDLALAFAREDAEVLVRSVNASTAPPSDEQVFATLKEICGQAIAAIDQRDLGCTLQLVDVGVGATPAERSESADL